jgi:hypothetical protein
MHRQTDERADRKIVIKMVRKIHGKTNKDREREKEREREREKERERVEKV